MSKKAFLQRKLHLLTESDEYWYGRNCLPYYKPILEHNIHCALKDIIVALGCRQHLSESRFVQDIIYLTYLKACLPSYIDMYIPSQVGYRADFRDYVTDSVTLLSKQVGKGKCLDQYLWYQFKDIENYIGDEVNLFAFSKDYKSSIFFSSLETLDHHVLMLSTKEEYLGLFYTY